ncbi:MAG: tetratricopeptide repeat protein [Alphaproteobacteria bacterium]|jgi:predicted O-linked N-acetylglucosamine transferase (SPINDLY family)|nr:tetratricopeptide repeat protein [Alphaproteobacteria bacterium]|tara:strand:- start:1548 stop:3458 length:1911 start_codon:yes stop_codon:yes gene_type:complete
MSLSEVLARAADHEAAGQSGQAMALCQEVLAREPSNLEALLRLGGLLAAANQLEAAAECFTTLLRDHPQHAVALGKMGVVQAELGLAAAARASLEKAAELDPQAALVFSNLGHLLFRSGDSATAAEHLQRAVELDPDLDIAWSNLGDVQRDSGRWDEAAICYRRALALAPDDGGVLGNLVYALMTLCRFAELEPALGRLAELAAAAQAAGRPSPIDPFLACFLELPMADFQRIASDRARAIAVTTTASTTEAGSDEGRPALSPRRAERLRIGYASGQFAGHATGHLVQDMFRHHDRRRFEIIGYGLKPSDGSELRRRIVADMDIFHDLSGHSDRQAADTMRRDRLDVLVDLDGFVSGNRNRVFALRGASLQVSYLGFPGTTGAAYMDYLIADRWLVPSEHEAFLSEAPVLLPGSYQVNSHRALGLGPVPPRAELGLPEGFVFCCFNVSRKIDAATLGLWLGLLERLPEAALWLLVDSPETLENLRREAAARGLDGERLIAAPRLDPEAHLARCQAADLFLDTLVCNAHTTASDALWAGVPVLTCPGASFAARVGASLVAAAGLDELIVATPSEYEETALELARNPGRLLNLRQRLQAGRETCALFDTAGLVGHLEAAFAEMVARQDRGEPPGRIVI